ncbi:leucine-rich melanocyte differentiation-associated protein-like isoform X2 [Littorina saxatilis]|uniref:Leucine-rich melanocyte differentiation-associated protein n=1 Tax=Littorina saxatilis TaxID=31220 RepID=A0AAN9BU52_9CAEN
MAAPMEGDSNTDPAQKDEEQDQDRPIFSDGQLSYLGHDVEEIPPEVIAEYAEKTVRLDLSFNRIQSLHGLERFTQLEELILDNNELSDDVIFPSMSTLTTLCLNKNRFLELEPLMQQLKLRFPQLSYLSLLGNAACPNQLSSTEKDEEDYQRYRYYVLFHLPQLKFLDSSGVQQAEMIEAKRRGQYMQVVRPAEEKEEEESGEAAPQYSPLPTGPQQQSDTDKHLGRWGKSRSRYLGRNSEGNRFITDMAL